MKKSLFSIIAMAMLCIMSCSKDEVESEIVATYRFNIENNVVDTRALVNPDQTVEWEEGDEIQLVIRLFDNESDKRITLEGGNVKAWEQEKRCKLVYSGSEWKIFEKMKEIDYTAPIEVLHEQILSEYKEVDAIELRSNPLNGYVDFWYVYYYSDRVEPEAMGPGGFMKIDFKEGLQTISIPVPENLK